MTPEERSLLLAIAETLRSVALRLNQPAAALGAAMETMERLQEQSMRWGVPVGGDTDTMEPMRPGVAYRIMSTQTLPG